MRILGVIPSRYNSSRFPGKPLAQIGGHSMISRVYAQALKVPELTDVLVATDDKRIADHIKELSGKVILTSPEHPSGTDRCYEAYSLMHEHYDVVINIQGDEPFIHPEQVSTLCKLFEDAGVQIGTLVKEIKAAAELFNPNSPKVVLDTYNNALYFSRTPVPYLHNVNPEQWPEKHKYYRHIGLYGYRSEILVEIARLKQGKLEKAESLEQLRWLENGYRIRVGFTSQESVAVDTPQDLEAAEAFLKTITPEMQDPAKKN